LPSSAAARISVIMSCGDVSVPSERLEGAIKAAWDSKEFQDALTSRGFETRWGDSVQFAEFLKQNDKE
jgi:hypothetical protein